MQPLYLCSASKTPGCTLSFHRTHPVRQPCARTSPWGFATRFPTCLPRGDAALRQASARPAAVLEEDAPTALEQFLGWLQANGVQGVGESDSKVAIFEGDHGERGLASLQDIERGEVLLRVPLRLAITEHPSDEESNALVYQGAPWSVRLAAKLLRMHSAGAASPWHPYLQVLPELVPTPHTTFGWEELQQVQYSPVLRDYDHAAWVASSAQRQLSTEATGGAGAEQLEWALSVVHSRSFGSPGEGGAAVRMLVPLVDFLNHAGDECNPDGGGALVGATARDNVRWDVQPPAGDGGEWHMAVTATRDIEEGEELLLSYGERSNDSFFQHYGFIPPRNPHDDVTLFDDIEEAVRWLTTEVVGQDASPSEQAAARAAALEAASKHLPPLGPQPTPSSEVEGEVMAREASRVRLLAGARLDSRLMAAFEALEQGRDQPVLQQGGASLQEGEAASGQAAAAAAAGAAAAERQRRFHATIALRCRELVAGMPTSLLEDLSLLAQWEAEERGSGPLQAHSFGSVLQSYRLDIEAYCREAGTSPEDPFGTAAATAAVAVAAAEGGMLVDAGAASLGGQDAVLLGLLGLLNEAPALAGQLAVEAGSEDAVASPQVAGEASGGSAAAVQLVTVYRAYKKMILWDAILAAAARP